MPELQTLCWLKIDNNWLQGKMNFNVTESTLDWFGILSVSSWIKYLQGIINTQCECRHSVQLFGGVFKEIKGKQLLKGHCIKGKVYLFMLIMQFVVLYALGKSVLYRKREGSLAKGLDEKAKIRIMGQIQCYLYRKDSLERKQTNKKKENAWSSDPLLSYWDCQSTKIRYQIWKWKDV